MLCVSITNEFFLLSTSRRWRDKGGERADWSTLIFPRVNYHDNRQPSEKWHEVADFVSRDERREIAQEEVLNAYICTCDRVNRDDFVVIQKLRLVSHFKKHFALITEMQWFIFAENRIAIIILYRIFETFKFYLKNFTISIIFLILISCLQNISYIFFYHASPLVLQKCSFPFYFITKTIHPWNAQYY